MKNRSKLLRNASAFRFFIRKTRKYLFFICVCLGVITFSQVYNTVKLYNQNEMLLCFAYGDRYKQYAKLGYIEVREVRFEEFTAMVNGIDFKLKFDRIKRENELYDKKHVKVASIR